MPGGYHQGLIPIVIQESDEMAETTPNPFENTNSGPTAPAPNAPAADATCCSAACTKGAVARVMSRTLLYGPVALLFAGIVAFWTVPGLANYVSPILSLIDPSFNKSGEGAGCCSSTLEKTGSCCAPVSKAAMLTSSVSSEEISLDTGAELEDDSCACCDDEDGMCPTTLKGKSGKTTDDASDE
jgi:hypothetical protein